MLIVEALLLSVMIFTCCCATYTDFKHSIVSNKLLSVSGAVCLLLNIVYYTFFARPYFLTFVINFAIITILSIFMYALNLWGAGDSKLLFLIVFAIPSRYYFIQNSFGLAPAIYIIVFTFSISFIYVVIESLVIRIRRKDRIQIKIIPRALLEYLKNYFVCSVYILLINYLLSLLFPVFTSQNASLIAIFNLFVTIVIYKYKVFFKLAVVLASLVVTITLIVISGIKNGFQLPDLSVYLYLAIILLLRSTAEKFNYEKVPTSSIKKGMILANATIALMLPSRINGLPTSTTEDMRSRLTEQEAESILRWEHSKYGFPEILIVRKIPFAIFMTIGTILFIIIRLGVI